MACGREGLRLGESLKPSIEPCRLVEAEVEEDMVEVDRKRVIS